MHTQTHRHTKNNQNQYSGVSNSSALSSSRLGTAHKQAATNKHTPSQHTLLQQSLGSHNTTFDKLQNLKPLRETQNQLNSCASQRVIQQHGGVQSTQAQKKRDKTPTNALAVGTQAAKYRRESQNLNHGATHEAHEYLSTEKQRSHHHHISNLTSSKSKTPTRQRPEPTHSIQTKQSTQKSQSRLQIYEEATRSVERQKQHQLIRGDCTGFRDNLDIYVVKGKKGQVVQGQQCNNLQSEVKPQAEQQKQGGEKKINGRARDRSKTPDATIVQKQQLNKSQQHRHSNQSSVMLQSVLKQSMMGQSSRKQESSAHKYSGVKSKVSQHLRSKTPNGQGAVLTQQQLMDQHERQQRRDYEIQLLENEVQQIQHDLLFAQNNKELMFEIFKPRDKSSARRMINEVSGQTFETEEDEVLREEGRRQKLVNLQSKKQFSSYEYQVQRHQFSDKYFDKVYLELCGIQDLQKGKLQHLEAEKQSMMHYYSKASQATIASTSPSLETQLALSHSDVSGSVTFFERRQDYQKDRSTISSVPQKYSVINLDSAYQTQEELVTRECDLNFGNEEQRQQRQLLRDENLRLVEDFDKTLEELISQRKTASNMAFYEAIHEYTYDKKQLDPTTLYRDPNGFTQTAVSPTKRLICMKNSSIEHYKQIREQNLVDHYGPGALGRGNALESSDKKTRVYLASPDRAYVVHQDKEIDYDLAFKKNPLKFYEEALNAPIIKHKIQHQRASMSPGDESMSEKKSTLGSVSNHSQSQRNIQTFQSAMGRASRQRDHEIYTINSKKTTRPHQRINQKIKSKIQTKLAAKLGSNLTQQVLQALEEANLQEAIQDLISEHSNPLHEDEGEEIDEGQGFEDNGERVEQIILDQDALQQVNPLDSDRHSKDGGQDANGFMFSYRDQGNGCGGRRGNHLQDLEYADVFQRENRNDRSGSSQRQGIAGTGVFGGEGKEELFFGGAVGSGKHGKAFSVHSALIQRQNLDDRNSRDGGSQRSDQVPKQQQAVLWPSLVQDGHPQTSNQQVFGSSQPRSGASSKFYHSENNAYTEENVKVNKAY